MSATASGEFETLHPRARSGRFAPKPCREVDGGPQALTAELRPAPGEEEWSLGPVKRRQWGRGGDEHGWLTIDADHHHHGVDPHSPARVTWASDGSRCEQFFQHGVPHRPDGKPAVVYYDTYGRVVGARWYEEGRLHRTDGPAEWTKGSTSQWWVRGDAVRPRRRERATQRFAVLMLGRTAEVPTEYGPRLGRITDVPAVGVCVVFDDGTHEPIDGDVDLIEFDPFDREQRAA